MFLQEISFVWFLSNVFVTSLPQYEINVQNAKVFEISSDSKDYDEENENEMIQPEDLADLKFDVLDESRYKPLHSYVDNYNKREAMNKVQYINELARLKPQIWEDSNVEEDDQPFIAGFKEDLDKIQDQNVRERVQRAKQNDEQSDTSPWKANDDTNKGEDDLIETTEPGEEAYDYHKFKKEYDEQITEDISSHNETFNDTIEEIKEQPKEVIKELFNFKNCTEVSKKLGINAIDCLLNNYEREKEIPAVKRTVSKVWLIIKVWFLVYICLAIPCWCHKGWCCCCFRCKLCFPRKRIDFAKKYYAINPPGTLSKEVKKQEEKQDFITYEPTEFEEDAYRTFEAAIRNI